MDKDEIILKIKRFFYILSKKTKKLYKKLKRIIRKYIRMLVRHTKAGDYTILVYSILVLIVAIFLIVSIGKLIFGGGDSSKEKTEATTEEITTEANLISPEEEAKRNLALQCKDAYDKNKDLLVLVNQDNPVPENYDFEHHTLNSGFEIDKRMLDDLRALLEACNSSGFEYNIISAYRSKETQQELFDEEVAKYSDNLSEEEAKKEALKNVQLPGYSEHHLGLSIDITSVDTTSLENFNKNDMTNKWLMDNCHNYGFIVRYPEDKIDITGISFEPWHYRYVGKEVASIMKINKLSFEEFMDMVEYSKTF
ncbi:MAG: M15 family metallopeptidase [Lachnospiraceae bacterium]|nr:M15 family metallopeptidase [Lachnospiraceae bacterium]